MSRPKLVASTAAGVLLCALAAGKRSRSDLERVRGDGEQMAALTE